MQAHGSRILLQAGAISVAQTDAAQQNPAAAGRPEHTPPTRPQQMKVIPRTGEGPQGALTPRSSTAEVLAELVRQAGVIFAGEVYAIRTPAGEANPGTTGGLPSSNPNIVEIEFRVDHGVRGAASVGERFVLRESVEHWQQAKLHLAPHDRAILFLYPPDQAGLSAPVGGPVGVLPLKGIDQVDLSRLHTLVTPAVGGSQANATPPNAVTANSAPASSTATNAPMGEAAPGSSSEKGQGTAPTPDLPATGSAGSTTAGQQDQQTAGGVTSGGGVSPGRMPELDAPHAPFLSVLRDIYMLAAAQGGAQ